MKIIGLFFPAFISLSIRCARDKKFSLRTASAVVTYGIYTLVNVLLATIIITYGLNVSGVTADALDSFPFFTKYMVIAVILAVCVPYLEEMVRKYIHIKLTVKGESHHDKKE
ncbi:MAG: hypothetical protein NC419_07245 [Muribaculaceae bacterium]|nr:hypothetical protein [Muribaculaceae bacterium]